MEVSQKKKPISIFGAFGLSLGVAIGWGTFVVTCSSYLSKAGPIGSIIGIVVGMLVMIVIAYNYHYLMNKYPNSNGGLYTFTKNVFGSDHAFLASWFLIITYFAMIWTNATSLAFFARYIFGNTFQFGFHYVIGGYDVYFGEVLLSVFFILLMGGVCLLNKKITTHIQFGLCVLFLAVLVALFIVAMVMHEGGFQTFEPSFAPTDDNYFTQVLAVISMAPWAFVGFESISNSSKDFNFSHKKTFKIMLISIIATTLIYIMACEISIAAFPDGFDNWYGYVSNSTSLSGLNGIPAFFVASNFTGTFGTVILLIALLAIIITSLIGNMYGLSNLLQTMSEDGVFPKFLSKKRKNSTPLGAILFILGISCFMPFLGRVAIGWIVDVNTIGGSIIYGYVSACVLKDSIKEKNKKNIVFSSMGLIFAVIFGLLMVVPNLIGTGDMSQQSFFIIVIWSIIGFIYFWIILKRDKNDIFGHSMVVWFGLLLLIIFATTVWLTQTVRTSEEDLIRSISEHFNSGSYEEDEFVNELRNASNASIIYRVVMTASILLITQVVLFNVFSTIKKRETEQIKKRLLAEEKAATDALTGIKNKYAYNLKVDEINELIDKNENNLFGVVVCDVNNLKYINDNFGHDFGDQLIKNASSMICNIFKHSPVYRIGGDEFVVILEGEDYENRETLIDELINLAIENNKEKNGIVIASGLDCFNSSSDSSFNSVFRKADQKMYACKQSLKASRSLS